MPKKVIAGREYIYDTPEELAKQIEADAGGDVGIPPQEPDLLTRLAKRAFGPKAVFWQSDVTPDPSFESPYEPKPATTADELQSMLGEVILAGGAGAAKLPGISSRTKTGGVAGRRLEPTDYSPGVMDTLSPAKRSKMRDMATPSELRYELHKREQRQKGLTARRPTLKPTAQRLDKEQELAQGEDVSRRVGARMQVDPLQREISRLAAGLSPEEVEKAARSAQRTSALWHQMGAPIEQSFPIAFKEALEARSGKSGRGMFKGNLTTEEIDALVEGLGK